MTPRERELVTELFDRLVRIEASPRDPDAERLIAQGVARAPNAIYALVQTVLLQNEALKQANERLREAGQRSGTAAPEGSFLDGMRREGLGQGSVPAVPQSKWNNGRVIGGTGFAAQPASAYPQDVASHSGSFLGTAAAAALGFIGGNLLFSGLRNTMGPAQASSFGSPFDNGGDRQGPWTSDASHGELAREAGLHDVGGGRDLRNNDNDGQSAGLIEPNAADDDKDWSDDAGGYDDGGFGDVSDA